MGKIDTICFRVHATLLVRDPVGGIGHDTLADVTTSGCRSDWNVRHVLGSRLRLRHTLRRTWGLGLVAQVHFTTMVAGTSNSSGSFFNNHISFCSQIFSGLQIESTK